MTQKSSHDDDNNVFIPKQSGQLQFYLVKGTLWNELKTVIPGASGQGFDDMWMENERIEAVRKYGGVIVNDAFIPLWDYDHGLMFLDGGYGSSKTTYVITRLLMKCRTHKYFYCLYGRQKKTDARNLHGSIIGEIERNHWQHEFKYSKNPQGNTEILHLATGNKFHLFGCDDDESLKGVVNPSDIFVDEINQISFDSFGMLFTRLRGSGYKTQLIGCFNNCDVFPDSWLVKYIYGDENSDDESQKILFESLRNTFTIKHHSTYLDNKCQNPKMYYQKLAIKAGGNPDKIKAYCEGEWGVRLNAQPYYKMFRQEIQCVPEIIVDGVTGYNPALPLCFSWDENSNPYLPVLIAQISGTRVYIIDEIAAVNPNNSLIWVTTELKSRYPNHKAGVKIYGDATSKKDDVKSETGKDFFQLIEAYLKEYRPETHVQNSNPNNEMRKDFVNAIFSLFYGGIQVIISRRCKHLIEDLMHTQEAPDGKGKDKTRTMVNGVRGVQRYGHFGDCLDYLLCEAFSYTYLLFQRGGVEHDIDYGQRIVLNTYRDAEGQENVLVREIEDKVVDENQNNYVNDDDDDYAFFGSYRRKSTNGY